MLDVFRSERQKWRTKVSQAQLGNYPSLTGFDARRPSFSAATLRAGW